MALETTGTATRPTVPPVSYITAVWLGMTAEDIAQGIADGIIDAPSGWSGAGADADASPRDVRTVRGRHTALDHADTNPHRDPAGSDSDSAATPVVGHDEVRAIFREVDPALADDAFDQIWTSAGDTDANRSTNLIGYLSRTLLGTTQTADGDLDLAGPIESLDAFLADAAHHGEIVHLRGETGEELTALAKSDAGYRYALLNLDSLAIVGNAALHIGSNAHGDLDRFDANTGEQNLSDAWLADRGKLLAWKLSTEASGSTVIDGSESWTFIDRRNTGADGAPYELELTGSGDDAATNTVVFGDDAEAGEILRGNTGTDRIYGGGGDDVLRGNAGDDHLEGGRGSDLVLGGSGSDDLSGDQGDDELEGGSGNDRLRGGADDDLLTGGRGDDRLEGGSGHDTYVIDGGDGADTIVDADADGEVVFEGQKLTGAADRQGTQWWSADGRVRYAFSGDAVEGGTLTISFYGAAHPAVDTPAENVTKVSGWHNGDLGIVLGDGTAAALAATDGPAVAALDAEAIDGPASVMHDPGTSGSDGQGNTWIEPIDIAPSSTDSPASDATGQQTPGDDLADLFNQLDTSAGVSSTLVTPENVATGLTSWAGVLEVPDISVALAPDSGPTAAVTPQDLSSALMDFHDGGDGLGDHGAAVPMPAVAPSVVDVLQTEEVSSVAIPGRSGVGNLQRRGG